MEITEALQFYHEQLPNCESSELRFLQGLVHAKALAKNDDARSQAQNIPATTATSKSSNAKKSSSLALPAWLQLWYESPGAYCLSKEEGNPGGVFFDSDHPDMPRPGTTLLHFLVDKGFSHCLREVLNSAQEWFTAETRDRLDTTTPGGISLRRFHGTLAHPGNMVPSLRGFVDAPDKQGCTALHRALSLEATDMVRLLLVHGASPWYRDPTSGLVPLVLAERLLNKVQCRGGFTPTSCIRRDLGVLCHHNDEVEGQDSGNEEGGVAPSNSHDPNSAASRTLAMVEGFPQSYTCRQQDAQPFGLVATNYFLWEPQAVVDAVQRRAYQEAILCCTHRSVKSALYCTMALELSLQLQRNRRESEYLEERGRRVEEGVPPHHRDHSAALTTIDVSRAHTMIVRWCLSALCCDVWNEKALELLLHILQSPEGVNREGQQNPIRTLLALELKSYYSHTQSADGLSTLQRQAGYKLDLSTLSVSKGVEAGGADDDLDTADTSSIHTVKTNRTMGDASSSFTMGSTRMGGDQLELLFPSTKDVTGMGLEHHLKNRTARAGRGNGPSGSTSAGRSVIDDVTGDVYVFVDAQPAACGEEAGGGPSKNETEGGLWVVLPHSYGAVQTATHGVVRSEVTLGFPFQTGELVIFEPCDPRDGGRRRLLRGIRGSSTSLSLFSPQTVASPAAPSPIKKFLRIWGISCDDSIEALATGYEWPIVSLVQLLQPGPRSCWTSMLRGRYGEQLWVAEATQEDEQTQLAKFHHGMGHSGAAIEGLGVGVIEWRPQYATRDGVYGAENWAPGRRVLYDKKTLRFVSGIPE